MGDYKWLILGQEMKEAWAPLWEPDLTAHGRGLLWGISCGYFGTSPDLVAQVPWHSLVGEDLGHRDISLEISNIAVGSTSS